MTRLVINASNEVRLLDDHGRVLDAVHIDDDGTCTNIAPPLPDGKTVEQETAGQASMLVLLFLAAYLSVIIIGGLLLWAVVQ